MNSLRDVMSDLHLKGGKGIAIAVISTLMSLFFLYTSFAGSFTTFVQRGLLLVFAMPLLFLTTPLPKKHPLSSIDLFLVFFSPVPFIYIAAIQDQLMSRGGIPNEMDIFMGVAATLIVLEATRRKIGLTLPIISVILILYGFFGPNMPAIIEHRGLDFGAMISALYLGEEGIFGVPIAVTADFIIIFILFGAFLQASGAGDFFIDLAKAGFGRMRGGPAKASVISSALMGTLSGSAIANVVTTGTFTIPLMKKTGYRAEIAAAIEAVASSGGQIMPPIMGAAAFIMADFLKVSYLNVIIAAAIPSILYYLSLFFIVDLEAAKNGLKGIPAADLPSAKATLLKSGYLVIPILVLIFLLGVVQYSPQKAAFYTIVILVVIAGIGAHTRLNAQKLVTALIKGARGSLEVAAVCACAGIAIGIIMRSGLGFTLTGILIEISRGNLLTLMILTMLVSTIMGMGLPTSACYIIVAVLIAPAMVQLGVVPIAAHLFAFYYATLSAITPPVALAAYAGAAVANAPPIRVGWHSFRIGLTGFVVPFMFVFGPSLLCIGSVSEIGTAFISASFGVFALSISLVGMLFTKVTAPLRILSFIAAMFLIKPGLLTDTIGLALLSIVAGVNFLQTRQKKAILEKEMTA